MAQRGDAVRVRRRTVAILRSRLVDVAPLGERPVVDLLRRERIVTSEALRRWLPRDVFDDLHAMGVVERVPAGIRPCVRIDVIEGLLIASDLRVRHDANDFVPGPGPASLLLARQVPAQRGGRVLDLGCGSGVLGLLRSDPTTRVTGVDINPRALAITRFNAELNDRPRVIVELGDFLAEPESGSVNGAFDTVVANPPFVLSPWWQLAYRDRPLPGDAVGERTVTRVAAALAPNGRGYVLCNWIDRGPSWSDPVRHWTASLGCDVRATRVRTLDPLAYASIWTAVLPHDEREVRTRAWAAALETEGVTRIHAGIVALRRRPAGSGPTTFEAVDAPTAREAVATLPPGQGNLGQREGVPVRRPMAG